MSAATIYREMTVNLKTYKEPDLKNSVAEAKESAEGLNSEEIYNSLKFTVTFDQIDSSGKYKPTMVYATTWLPYEATAAQNYVGYENLVIGNTGYEWDGTRGFNTDNTITGDGEIRFNYSDPKWIGKNGILNDGTSSFQGIEAEDVSSFPAGGVSPYWIAVGNDGGGYGNIMNSRNGQSWDVINTGGSFDTWGYGVAYGTSNGIEPLWVTVGNDIGANGYNKIMYSSDGKTWKVSSSSGDSFVGSAGRGYGVAYGTSNGTSPLWVAVGDGNADGDDWNNIMHSSDGKTWEVSSSSGASFDTYGRAVAYGTSDGTSPLWVAVGDGNEDGDDWDNIMFSSDGKTWEVSSGSGSNFSTRGYGVAYGTSNGTSPLWVAVGDGDAGGDDYNNIMYSSDGKIWEFSSSGNNFSTYGLGVAYGTSDGVCPLWVAVGYDLNLNNNNIMYSGDGKTWELSSSSGGSFDSGGFGVAYGETPEGAPLWVAVGTGGGGGVDKWNNVMYSSDGKTWELSSSSGTSFDYGYRVAFNNLLHGMKPTNNFPNPIKDAYISVFSTDGSTDWTVNYSYGGHQLVSSNNDDSNQYLYAIEEDAGEFRGYKTVFDGTTYEFFNSAVPNCIDENTKVLCLNKDSEEEEILVKDLKPGDIVKTYKQGYRRINKIGYIDGFNRANSEEIKYCRLVLRKTEENSLNDDLYVSALHFILMDELTSMQEYKEKEACGRIFKVMDKYLVQARHYPDFEIVEKKGYYRYYQMTLENDDDIHQRHGIYTNGLLTETTCLHDFDDFEHIKQIV